MTRIKDRRRSSTTPAGVRCVPEPSGDSGNLFRLPPETRGSLAFLFVVALLIAVLA